jgi:hypothetical protein
MKKFTAILFAVLILASGMHPAISAHLCGESVAAVKWSFTGENASCGMPTHDQEIPREGIINQACCENVTAVFSVDEDYSPTSFDFNMTPELSPVIYTLVTNLMLVELANHTSNLDSENSLASFLARSVSLPDL